MLGGRLRSGYRSEDTLDGRLRRSVTWADVSMRRPLPCILVLRARRVSHNISSCICCPWTIHVGGSCTLHPFETVSGHKWAVLHYTRGYNSRHSLIVTHLTTERPVLLDGRRADGVVVIESGGLARVEMMTVSSNELEASASICDKVGIEWSVSVAVARVGGTGLSPSKQCLLVFVEVEIRRDECSFKYFDR